MTEALALIEAQQQAMATMGQPEWLERMQEARESLESLDNVKFPQIKFKDGFTLQEGAKPIFEFQGIILFTKQSNAYFKNAFDPRKIAAPDCFSPDGKRPSTEIPQAANCKVCPLNKYESGKDGKGKACKNMRPMFVLFPGSVIPRVLRVPPTSLKIAESYITNCAADFGSYRYVMTNFTAFKKDNAQGHYNIGFQMIEALTPEQKANIKMFMTHWQDEFAASSVIPDQDEPDILEAQVAPETQQQTTPPANGDKAKMVF